MRKSLLMFLILILLSLTLSACERAPGSDVSIPIKMKYGKAGEVSPAFFILNM